eukprot:Gb_10071 [translate_table: standard]
MQINILHHRCIRFLFPCTHQIHELPAGHALRTHDLRYLINRSQHFLHRDSLGCPNHVLECQAQKRIASEDCHVLAEELVVGRLALVDGHVVHARQVVVGQGGCVEHLQCAGQGQGSIP